MSRYAQRWDKEAAVELLSEVNAGPRTTLADSTVFRIKPPTELGGGLDDGAGLEDLAREAAG